jgi:signal transduction histidine kinase
VHPAAPDPYSQPLTPWGQTWRLLVCGAVSFLVWSQAVPQETGSKAWLFWVDLALGVPSFVLVLGRRRHPLAVALVLALCGAVSASVSGPASLALVSLATRRNVPQLVGVGLVSVASGAVLDTLAPTDDSESWWVSVLFAAVVTAGLVFWGLYIGSRRELLWSLRDRAEQAERQQELRVERARALERERIAREMHDVLAHRISLITMHSGALAYRTDLPPEQVRETAGLISDKAHEALVELREVLGVLRESEPTHPQPTLVELGALVEETAGSGMRVRLDDTLADPTTVPDRIGRTVYRLVQEALTNARKHAPGSSVVVELAGGRGDGVRVAVRNGRNGLTDPTAQTGAGLGFVGMRERVELAGGRLDVRDDQGVFVLEGWLPWPA